MPYRSNVFYSDPTIAKAADSIAGAIFGSPGDMAKQKLMLTQAARLRANEGRDAAHQQAYQNIADLMASGDVRSAIARAAATGDPAAMRAMGDYSLAYRGNDPGATPGQLMGSFLGAGHPVGPDNAFSLPQQDQISARNANEAQGQAVAVQDARNHGAMDQLQYSTGNPTDVAGVLAQHMRNGSMTPDHGAYLRYGHGPEAPSSGGGHGNPMLDAKYMDQLVPNINAAIDAQAGIVRDKNGSVVSGTDLAPQDRQMLFKDAFQRFKDQISAYQNQQRSAPPSIDEATMSAMQDFGSLQTTPGFHWYNPSTWGNGDPQQTFGRQTPQPGQTAPAPDSSSIAGQFGQAQPGQPSVVLIGPDGRRWTAQDVQDTASNHGLTPQQVVDQLKAKGFQVPQ